MPLHSLMSMGTPLFYFKLKFSYDKYSVDKVWTKIYCHFYFRGITLRIGKLLLYLERMSCKNWKNNQTYLSFLFSFLLPSMLQWSRNAITHSMWLLENRSNTLQEQKRSNATTSISYHTGKVWVKWIWKLYFWYKQSHPVLCLENDKAKVLWDIP